MFRKNKMSWKDNIKAWQIILAITMVVVFASIGVGKFIYAFDQKKADKVVVVGLSKQVQAISVDQERAGIQRQIWEIEDRFQCGPRYGNHCYGIIKDKTICKSLLNLQEDLKVKQNKLNSLRK